MGNERARAIRSWCCFAIHWLVVFCAGEMFVIAGGLWLYVLAFAIPTLVAESREKWSAIVNLTSQFARWRKRCLPRSTHNRNARLLQSIEFLLPQPMRGDALGTMKDDIETMMQLGWSPRRIRKYLWWQLFMAIAPAIGRAIRKSAIWGGLAVFGQRVLHWLGG